MSDIRALWEKLLRSAAEQSREPENNRAAGAWRRLCARTLEDRILYSVTPMMVDAAEIDAEEAQAAAAEALAAETITVGPSSGDAEAAPAADASEVAMQFDATIEGFMDSIDSLDGDSPSQTTGLDF